MFSARQSAAAVAVVRTVVQRRYGWDWDNGVVSTVIQTGVREGGSAGTSDYTADNLHSDTRNTASTLVALFIPLALERLWSGAQTHRRAKAAWSS